MSEDAAKAFFSDIDKRAGGEPLQYIIEEWDMLGYTFKVGNGVLVPRPETEVLIETALKTIEGKIRPVVYDLCSGSGCVAICIAKVRPDAKVYALELSDIAFWYLHDNIERHGVVNVNPVKGDVLKNYRGFARECADMIVSNPPYIKSGDIAGLQREVQREPHMALDGGEDGLQFYRAIADGWQQAVNPGGSIVVEVGAGQSIDVAEIFRKSGIYDIGRTKDLSGIERVVFGKINGL